jgi:uncharacterized protein YdaU (DUF1376 family)
MSALPYMQLYIADYLADTMHLNAAQHGAYLLLIMNYWQRGKPLQNNDERLANVACMSAKDWSKNRDIIAEFFTVTDEEWVHGRVELDLERVTGTQGKCSKAGKASANKRATKRQQESNMGSTSVSTNNQQNGQHKSNHTDIDKNNKEQPPYPPCLLFEPAMISRRVMADAGLSSDRVWRALEGQVKLEVDEGCSEPTADALVARMVSAWQRFQKATSRLEFKWGAEKFFGEGYWRDDALWPWKPGESPPPPRKKQEMSEEDKAAYARLREMEHDEKHAVR